MRIRESEFSFGGRKSVGLLGIGEGLSVTFRGVEGADPETVTETQNVLTVALTTYLYLYVWILGLEFGRKTRLEVGVTGFIIIIIFNEQKNNLEGIKYYKIIIK